ncbi:hypothetical protein TL16_g13409, partial [Triparma laevis f. inornata]
MPLRIAARRTEAKRGQGTVECVVINACYGFEIAKLLKDNPLGALARIKDRIDGKYDFDFKDFISRDSKMQKGDTPFKTGSMLQDM